MADEDIARAKTLLRLKARAARRALTPEQRTDAEHRLALALYSLPELAHAHAVLSYAAMSEEIDPQSAVERLFTRGTRIALPRVLGPRKLQLHWWEPGDELVIGELGIQEPSPDAPVASVAAIDAVLTPGVAYDRSGWRLGFGAGYYDALFAEMHESILRIGLAFEEQVFTELPHDENDQPVEIVVTPRHVYRPTGRRH